MSFFLDFARNAYRDKQTQVVLFSSTAIALYGYDQGMMSLSMRLFLCCLRLLY